MKISFTSTYNALDPFEWSEIPKLSIIMGRNGVGKSQLLKLIENTFNQNSPEIPSAVIDSVSIGHDKALLVDQWSISDPQIIGDNEKEQIIQQVQSEFRNFTQGARNFRGKKKSIFESLIACGISYQSSLEEFSRNIPDDFYIDEETLLSYRLGYSFREYYRKYAELTAKVAREGLDMVSELDAFKQSNGIAPWDIFNEMMTAAGLEFKVKELITLDKQAIYLFDAQNRQIQWSHVSSGEKTLIQLACWLLYKTLSSDSFPKVLLLDEPDASLHPAMVKNLLAVVNDSIVLELGINVIMSTHSPTTVALAPAQSLFELKKNPTTITPIKREDAIEILSDGLVIVSENTRYVFLEGQNDPQFYQTQYTSDIRNHNLPKIPSLAFTPISIVPPVGVQEVIKLVDRLDGTGLHGKVKGLIDLDNGNASSSTIEVLKRYAIENYIFDPLVIGLSLVYKGKTNVLKSTSGLTSNDLFTVLNNPTLAQAIVDEVCAILESVATSAIVNQKEKTITKVLFAKNSALSYEIPKWFFDVPKSDIEPNVVYKPSPISSLISRKDNLLVIEATGLVFQDLDDILRSLQS